MQNTTIIESVLQTLGAGRAGPRPLPVHVMMALADYAQRGVSPQHIRQDMEDMVAGIQRYQAYGYARALPPLPVVWQEGEARLLYAAPSRWDEGAGENAAPLSGRVGAYPALFIVPSMINRSYILDLMPAQSFVRWLAAQGVAVYVLDWGNPVDDAHMACTEDLVCQRLVPAMRAAQDHVAKHDGGALYGMGYCMGGTLLAAGVVLRPDILAGVIFLASPWDFHAGDKTLAQHIQAGAASGLQIIEAKGHLPVDWIQSVFAAVNGERTVQKFASFKTMPAGPGADLFVAVEDWLNDGVDLPGAVARTCIMDWYVHNKCAAGQWVVGDTPIDLRAVAVPCLVVASTRDRLVPHAGSMAMVAALAECDVLEPAIGHIGMMTGQRAKDAVWAPVRDWLLRRSAA